MSILTYQQLLLLNQVKFPDSVQNIARHVKLSEDGVVSIYIFRKHNKLKWENLQFFLLFPTIHCSQRCEVQFNVEKKIVLFQFQFFIIKIIFGGKVFTCHLYSFFHFVLIPSPSTVLPPPPHPALSILPHFPGIALSLLTLLSEVRLLFQGGENTVVNLNNICIILVLEVVPFQVGDRYLVRVCQTQNLLRLSLTCLRWSCQFQNSNFAVSVFHFHLGNIQLPFYPLVTH